MNPSIKLLPLTLFLGVMVYLGCSRVDELRTDSIDKKPVFDDARRVGRLMDDRLVECSGIDTSSVDKNLLWAINDSGQGPYIYALEINGQALGRYLVAGTANRDWEGIDTFRWKGRPMILIADFGDNREQHQSHTLYVVNEPIVNIKQTDEPGTVEVAWCVVFSYPDGNHDAEAVAVDINEGKILILTKRDNPPNLFEIPLRPSLPQPVLARKVGVIGRIPPPSDEDLQYKYGKYRSQPTAMDLSPDGRLAVVLTYKHAYLYKRHYDSKWSSVFSSVPILVPLPTPQETNDFQQREAICFGPDGITLLVTSEGLGAGIYRLDPK